jgi:hypothetical protein
VRDRLLGLLLFLPVPCVLWLFTQGPLGIAPSLTVGILLVATHRLYARPFALARAQRRCLWCGAAVEGGTEIAVTEPFGPTRWRTCGPDHLRPLAGTLSFAGRHSLFLRVGILGSLGLFLVTAVASATGRGGALTVGDATAALRLGVAASVLPLGWVGARSAAMEPYVPPFPVHIQALIGTRAVLWLFRWVGIAWLILGVIHVAERFGAAPL